MKNCECRKKLEYLEFMVHQAKSEYEKNSLYWVKAVQGGARIAELAEHDMGVIDSYLQEHTKYICDCDDYKKLEKIEKVVDDYRAHIKYNEEPSRLSALKRCSFISIAMIIDEENAILSIGGEDIDCRK